jgi:NADH dehydrogenase FAD-containing subunit
MKDWITFEDINGNIHYINRHCVAQISPNGQKGIHAATVIVVGGGLMGIQVALTPQEVIDKLVSADL